MSNTTIISHVIPVNDSKPHEFTYDTSCWCNPSVRVIGTTNLVTHNPEGDADEWENIIVEKENAELR